MLVHATYTENGQFALKKTENALLELFSECGAMRLRDPHEIALKFLAAYKEDRELALRLAFYTRDVLFGLGERRCGRIFFQTLAEFAPEDLKQNLSYIAEFGRFDDYLCLLDTPLYEEVTSFLYEQLQKDLCAMENAQPISLLAKWLPSANASSRKTMRYARILEQGFHMREEEYRKTLSSLRAYLRVTECSLSKKEYSAIEYAHVPSKAMMNYRRAFYRNDKERFVTYLDSLKKGKAKISAKALYPYEIAERYAYLSEADPVLEAQWKTLPSFGKTKRNLLVMADVSGSMSGRPLAISTSLALYFAQRNEGVFKNRFLTFSRYPELVQIHGESVFEQLQNIQSADWMMNTDLAAAFQLLLDRAVSADSPEEDMPSAIAVISDMEFDHCTLQDKLFYQEMKGRYEADGYRLPKIIFWNVNSRHTLFHADAENDNILLLSGAAISIFESLLENMDLTPMDYLKSVLNQKRYQKIKPAV